MENILEMPLDLCYIGKHKGRNYLYHYYNNLPSFLKSIKIPKKFGIERDSLGIHFHIFKEATKGLDCLKAKIINSTITTQLQ